VMLRAANDHARALQALGERLSAAMDEAQVFQSGCESLAAALGCESVVLRREGGVTGTLRRACAQPTSARLEHKDLAAADWVAAHAQAAGRFTDTLAGSPWLFLPMIVEGGCLGAVGLRFPPDQQILADEQRQLGEAIAQQIALAADRVQLAANLETSRVENETERLRTALLSSVSHDLRSPLSSMIGAATSLSAYGETMNQADRGELFESIRSEGERLDRYIQNLLDMTRLGSGPMKLNRDWIGLDEILGTATSRLHKLYPRVEVKTQLAEGLPPLWVHPALVEQAVFNILENAAKFSPPNEPIIVQSRYSDRKLALDITDRGPGIPEDERRRIFDMFYSAARGDRGRGTGLGLTIVRGLIGAHGGNVEALAGPGGIGTTIRVSLPIAEPPANSRS
jgi:two-component system sensor histidine kinase KdpD